MEQEKGNQPQFTIQLDGLQYGCRNLTVREQASAMVEIDLLTNGKYAEWVANEATQISAHVVQIGVFLNRVIVKWPVGMNPINFLDNDDYPLMLRYWEAFTEASQNFRDQRRGKGKEVGEG